MKVKLFSSKTINAIIPLLAVMMFFMEGCSFLKLKKDEYPDYNLELAKEVILSYLTEKYDKEFSIINEPQKMTDTIVFGNVWYTYKIMVEDDKNNENSDIYEVHVEY
ncbi:MAG: hypothetical protein K2K66_04445 [Ruminococcus sp.]|nr:hypothetical protein [Ruminococcus sp.]